MRSATVLLAAVAILGGAHGAAVPHSETTTAEVTVTEEVTATTTVTEAAPISTEAFITETETATPESTETATTEATPVETATETATATETETSTETSVLTETVIGAIDCLKSIPATCGDCITQDGFLPKIDAQCLMTCVTADENQAALNEKCEAFGIDFQQFGTCHQTLQDTCGKCMEVEGEIFGLHKLDIDEDCFETCYWANKDAIRAACPLPAPVQAAYECHKKLGETCGDCVDDDHDIDQQCLDKCVAANEAEISAVCPDNIMKIFGEIAQLEDDDRAVQALFNDVLQNLGVPTELFALLPFDVEDFVEDVLDGDIDLAQLFQTALNEDGSLNFKALVDAIVATQDDDDDDDDDDHFHGNHGHEHDGHDHDDDDHDHDHDDDEDDHFHGNHGHDHSGHDHHGDDDATTTTAMGEAESATETATTEVTETATA